MKQPNFLNIGFLFLVFLFANDVKMNAQLDWVSWSSVQLNYKAGEKLTVKLKPIWRQKNNLSDYDNTSIDLILSYKINKNWSLDFNNRHWFLPNDDDDREFWFFDINHKVSLSPKFTFSNKLRYHLGIDWNRDDPDFLRWLTRLSYNTGKRINPFIGNDIFYRTSESALFARTRYKIGAVAKISNKTKLTVEYWRQFNFNSGFKGPEGNFLVVNYSYNLN